MDPLLPVDLPLDTPSHLFAGGKLTVRLNAGLSVLVGPNGSGKTHVLRAMLAPLRDRLREHSGDAKSVVRYLASGRMSPLEEFRSKLLNPGAQDNRPAAVGNISYMSQRHNFESVVGDLLTLQDRPDLRIKVEARLYALFNRRMRLEWTQTGVRATFLGSGVAYPANTEASGVLHLVGLLAALYDNEVGALLIDEPEISLHPQLQAFLLDEARRVAGDPIADPSKKVVVMSTHAQGMLPLRRISDLPNLIFFVDAATLPMQVSSDAGELKRRALGAFIGRISESHRAALFARTILLLEGASDEIILSALASRFDHTFSGAGAQLLPVNGKGEMSETARLFRLMAKRVVALADLDALADDTALVQTFAEDRKARAAATLAGHADLGAMDRVVRSSFSEAVSRWWLEIEPLASKHRYLSDRGDDGAPTEKAKRRAALSVLLCADRTALKELPHGSNWLELLDRIIALTSALEAGGCFFIRRGTIEDCYLSQSASMTTGKPEAAAAEASAFPDLPEDRLSVNYNDALRAVRFAAPLSPVTEGLFLRTQLAALLGAIFESLHSDMKDTEIATLAESVNPDAAKIFTLTNASMEVGGVPAVRVTVA